MERLSQESAANFQTRGGISDRDPSSMTAAERLQEVNELFGSAYLRLLISREESEKGVADRRESERPWGCVVDRTENDSQEDA